MMSFASREGTFDGLAGPLRENPPPKQFLPANQRSHVRFVCGPVRYPTDSIDGTFGWEANASDRFAQLWEKNKLSESCVFAIGGNSANRGRRSL